MFDLCDPFVFKIYWELPPSGIFFAVKDFYADSSLVSWTFLMGDGDLNYWLACLKWFGDPCPELATDFLMSSFLLAAGALLRSTLEGSIKDSDFVYFNVEFYGF